MNRYQTDPTDSDTDGDSLSDNAEVTTHGTNPNTADTDSDGLTDGAELRDGTNPQEPTAPDEGLLPVIVPFVSRRTGLILGSVIGLGVGIIALGRWVGVVPSRSSLRQRLDPRQDDTETGSDSETGTELGPGEMAGKTESGTSEESGAETAPTTDAAVLTNEERVNKLLSDNGGRMLQSDMVEAADWSKATVSRVLTRMEERGAVTRIDVGQGNLVTLPGEELENARSA